jgi:hypothetical protein
MRASVKTAAYGLLKSLTPPEVEELCEVLTYFNTHCREDSRAECLAQGCEMEKKSMTENKTAGSTNIYMSGSQSVCPCCRR